MVDHWRVCNDDIPVAYKRPEDVMLGLQMALEGFSRKAGATNLRMHVEHMEGEWKHVEHMGGEVGFLWIKELRQSQGPYSLPLPWEYRFQQYFSGDYWH
jgi:hypothetical protein